MNLRRQKRKTLQRVTLAAAFACVGLAARALLAADPASPAAAEAVSARRAPPAQSSAPPSVTDRLAHRVIFDGSDDSALFAPSSWYVPPPPPPPPPPVKPAPPTAPPLPYTYLGSYLRDGEALLYFLVKGNRIYTVRAGDELDGTYRIDGVENSQLLLTYKPLNVQQSLFIGGALQ